MLLTLLTAFFFSFAGIAAQNGKPAQVVTKDSLAQVVLQQPDQLIMIWGSWCAPCVHKIKDRAYFDMAQAHHLQLVYIATDHDYKRLEQIAQNYVDYDCRYLITDEKSFADDETGRINQVLEALGVDTRFNERISPQFLVRRDGKNVFFGGPHGLEEYLE